MKFEICLAHNLTGTSKQENFSNSIVMLILYHVKNGWSITSSRKLFVAKRMYFLCDSFWQATQKRQQTVILPL